MLKRRLGPDYLMLVRSWTVAACGGPVSSPVALRTTDTTCYASGIDRDLVADPATGTAVTGSCYGGRVTLAWPLGCTGRSAGSRVDVIDGHDHAADRTETRVSLLGGFGRSRDFEVCGLEIVHP